MIWLRRRLQADARGDGGFTIMEVVVAMMVIAIGLIGLMTIQMRSIKTLGLAKQRQAASALTSRAVEQLRALPYTTVSGGLACSDLTSATDPNLVVTGTSSACTATFRPTYDSTINEVVLTTTGTTAPPLNPHTQAVASTTVDNVQYTVRNYVTRVNSDPSVDGGYWLTVITTWRSAVTEGQTKSIALRSQLYSPQGCLANTTHPFSGPCQAFYYSDSGTTGGSLTVQSTRTGLPIVDGIDASTATLALHGLSSRIQSEQVVSAQAAAATSGWKLISTTASTTAGGAASGSSTADTDPATGTSNSPTSATTVAQTGSSGNSSGGGNQLQVSQGAGDAGSSYATMATTGSPACQDNGGTAVSNGRTCATSAITNADAAAMTLSLNPLGARNLVLASVAANTTPSQAFGARYQTSGTNHCTATSGSGCIAAGVSRSVGTVQIGVMPTGATTINGTAQASSAFTSGSALVVVSSYTDTASTESGFGAASFTPSRSGSVRYWNGSAFVTQSLGASGATYSIGTTTAAYGTTTITTSGTITSTAPGVTTSGSSPCSVTACLTKATGGGLVVRLTYSITTGGAVVGAFTTTFDIGTALSQTSYKAAPVA
jgi:type IV pilus modification protein PilV